MTEKEINKAVVLNQVRKDKITVSKGAELLGMPIQDFPDLVYQHGIYLDDTPEEYEESLQDYLKLLL